MKRLGVSEAGEGAPAETPQRGLLHRGMVDALAIGSSLLTAAVTAWTLVETKAYKNMSSLGAFDDMKPKRKIKFDAIESGIEQGKISPRQSYRLIDALVETNEMEAQSRLHKVGIHSFWDRWNILRRHQKLETVLFSVAAGGVALGAVLPLAHGLFTEPQRQALDKPDAERQISH